jgi:putative membrane protein
MEQWIANHVRGIVDSLIYSVLGIVILVTLFWFVQRLLPFSIKKEIEEDQNISLGIILAAFIIGISMIIAAVLRS